MIESILIIATFFMSSCNSNSQNNEIYFSIDFQDFFQEDEVSLKIDKCKIFENLILISDESVGLTSVQVISKSNELTLFYDEDTKSKERQLGENRKQKSISCNLTENGSHLIQITLNGKLNSFNVDLSKGKYIGFEKSENNTIKFSQNQEPFEYD